jgi:DNA-binding FadR family transcriptional regulator
VSGRYEPGATRVNARQRWNFLDPDVLAWIFQGEPDEGVLNALFELRDRVEPAAAALAAQRRTPRQLEVLHLALNDMRVSMLTTDVGLSADRAFHATLLEATQNPFLISLASGVAAAIHITTLFKQRKGPLRRNPLPDHERVYEAIAAKNSAHARSAMRRLIRLAHIDAARAANGGQKAGGRGAVLACARAASHHRITESRKIIR